MFLYQTILIQGYSFIFFFVRFFGSFRWARRGPIWITAGYQRSCPLRHEVFQLVGRGTCVYADVASLYPYINSTCFYPLSHPNIIGWDFGDPGKYFGLIRAVVHPLRGPYIPLLPYKTSRGKVVFTLRRTCAEINNQQGACEHGEDARALMGVGDGGAEEALQLDYRLAEITEVAFWHAQQHCVSGVHGRFHEAQAGSYRASRMGEGRWRASEIHLGASWEVGYSAEGR